MAPRRYRGPPAPAGTRRRSHVGTQRTTHARGGPCRPARRDPRRAVPAGRPSSDRTAAHGAVRGQPHHRAPGPARPRDPGSHRAPARTRQLRQPARRGNPAGPTHRLRRRHGSARPHCDRQCRAGRDGARTGPRGRGAAVRRRGAGGPHPASPLGQRHADLVRRQLLRAVLGTRIARENLRDEPFYSILEQKYRTPWPGRTTCSGPPWPTGGSPVTCTSPPGPGAPDRAHLVHQPDREPVLFEYLHVAASRVTYRLSLDR